MNREREGSLKEDRKVWTGALQASLSGSVCVRVCACVCVFRKMQNRD